MPSWTQINKNVMSNIEYNFEISFVVIGRGNPGVSSGWPWLLPLKTLTLGWGKGKGQGIWGVEG